MERMNGKFTFGGLDVGLSVDGGMGHYSYIAHCIAWGCLRIDVSQATSSRVLFIGDMNTRSNPRRMEEEIVNERVPPQDPQGDQVPLGNQVPVEPRP
ncbi:hypothetical protein MTR67_051938 [Solanum verrucosum]|uniref:Uncharacterized protein n=1 Tax=Solanum verrucosum TaxID=315347 RepID=A0AAF0V471_SOLVR|nr:hypothetical protein MTR67_051938 [Solanum verrucosum]